MIIGAKNIEIKIGADEVDEIVKKRLTQDAFTIVSEINKFRENISSYGNTALDQANIKDNLYYLDGIKTVLSYYLPMTEYEEIFRQIDAKLYK